MALTTDTVILRAAIALALERGLDFAPEGFVDVDGIEVSPLDFALMVSARLASPPLPSPDESESAPPGRVPARPGVRALRQVIRLRQSMMTRLLAAVDLAYEHALRQAGVKIMTRARNRSGKQRAASVCAAVENHEPLKVWLTAVGITEMELLDRSFDVFRAQATRELTRYRDRTLAITGRAGFALKPDRFQVDDAVKLLVAGLTAMARSRLLYGAEAKQAASAIPRKGLPDVPRARRVSVPEHFDPGFVGRVDTDELSAAGARLVRNATAVADGNASMRLPTTADKMPVVVTNTDTPTLMDSLSMEFTVSPVWSWVHGFYGDPDHPLDSHELLDGFETTDRDEDEGLVNPDSWPDGDYLFPGDHDGCTCEWIPIEGEAGAAEAGGPGTPAADLTTLEEDLAAQAVPEPVVPEPVVPEPEPPEPPPPEPPPPEPEPVVPEPVVPEPPPPEPEPTPPADAYAPRDWQLETKPRGEGATPEEREAYQQNIEDQRKSLIDLRWQDLKIPDEQEAAGWYGNAGFEPMNELARYGTFDEGEYEMSKLELLKMNGDLARAINRGQTLQDLTAYRYVEAPPGSAFAESLQPGAKFVDKGFTSTTLVPDQVAPGGLNINPTGGEIRMEIAVPAGTKGLWLGPDEAELLLQRNTKFEVIERVGNVVRVRVI